MKKQFLEFLEKKNFGLYGFSRNKETAVSCAHILKVLEIIFYWIESAHG